MKFNCNITFLAVAMCIGAASAQAADGTITINGTITDATCTIKVAAGPLGSSGSTTATVTLPTVSTADLASATQSAGDTEFSISTNCSNKGTTVPITKVSTYFDPSAANVNANGRLTPTAGAGVASNVDIQITDVAKNPILLNMVSGSQNVPLLTLGAVNTDNEQHFYARYYATGVATAGTANTSIGFTQVYQ